MGGFVFQVACLRLVANGPPMGSPLSPVLAYIFIKKIREHSHHKVQASTKNMEEIRG